jgi:phage tail-like protein
MAPRNDPYKNFKFRVEIDNMTIAGFSECTGLESEVTCIEYREGADHVTRKLPGLHKVSNITLKRGVTKSTELWDWHKNIVNGLADRRNGSIILLDDDGTEAVRWNFSNGFPRKYEAPNFNAKGNEVAIESIEICHEGIDRAS